MLSTVNVLLNGEYSNQILFSTFIGIYTAYYFLAARSPPTLYGSSQKLIQFFHCHIPFLREIYSPFVFGFTGRIQTILRPIFYWAEKINYKEECVCLPDGGELQLSWSNAEGMPANTPITVILPGLTGCGCCSYIASLVKDINDCNYRCVVVNNRGTCKNKIKTPKTYCASHTSDVAAVFDHIRERYPEAPIAGVGISLGGILLFNYLAEEQSDPAKPCPLTAAMCICMPWDLLQTCNKMEKSVDWLLFNYPLAKGMRRIVNRNAEVLAEKYDVDRIMKIRSCREFDEVLTVKMFGYNTADEYYTHASPVKRIHRVRVPVLCLNAADDPFVPFNTLPLDTVKNSDTNVTLAITRHGGHIGFLTGFKPTRPNLMDRAVPQFATAIFEHRKEFLQLLKENKVDCPVTESASLGG